MTSTTRAKQPSTPKKCDICQKHAGILLCTGCDQTFCRKDLNEHRQQLSTQLDTIIREHDFLKQNMEQTCDATTSKLFDEIDKWEMEWMKKVKMAADRAREEVRDIVAEPKKELKRIADEIRPRMAEEDFVEYDLDRWMGEINQLTVDMKGMSSTIVVESGDESEWKRMIKVRTMEHQSHVFKSPQRSEKRDSEVKQLDFNKLKDRSQRQIKVDENYEMMGASDIHLLYCDKNTLCWTDRTGHETNTVQWRGDTVWGICWSLFLDRFLILTKRTLHSLNVQTSELTLIKQVSDKKKADLWTCTCLNQTLLLSFDHDGSVVEEWDMSGEWKMMRRWQPPLSCHRNEWISDIRFSFDGSQLGVTVCAPGRYNQFHVRDRSMKIIDNSIFPPWKYGYRLLSLPNGQWLTHQWKNKELYMINRDGKFEQTLTYDKSVKRAALLEQICLVILTDDSKLCFHDL
ncbi:unnamed protein product [Didymodactylos carnosus]|uniref:B box-type domain-containing protein n=1 Tax=Didymodactylos carnosus TaxID=1234261 RepID=A0A815WT49_9BILA|nr:unnamed protein product [Didymodactylos carnosus]CAF1553298.1 unnamed protein product [Didymodactylos carnosus]CAF4012305.1 unnamed protein product [Didymodactylos carnosus]CAF4414430.1 unnamed protein product [Didymodactylos carnosus]